MKSTCPIAHTNENNNDYTDEQNLNSSLGLRSTNFVDFSMSEYTSHFGLGRRRRMNASRRWFGAFRRHDSGHVVISDGSESNGEEGQHYISSLELTEEGPRGGADGNESIQPQHFENHRGGIILQNTNRILRPQILRGTDQAEGDPRVSSLSFPLRADSTIV